MKQIRKHSLDIYFHQVSTLAICGRYIAKNVNARILPLNTILVHRAWAAALVRALQEFAAVGAWVMPISSLVLMVLGASLPRKSDSDGRQQP